MLAAISWSSIGPERSFIVVVTRALRYGDSAARMMRWALKLRPSTLISTSHKVSLRHISVRVSRRLSAEVSMAFTVRVSGVPAEVDPGREGRCRFLGAIAAFQVPSLPARALPACLRPPCLHEKTCASPSKGGISADDKRGLQRVSK